MTEDAKLIEALELIFKDFDQFMNERDHDPAYITVGALKTMHQALIRLRALTQPGLVDPSAGGWQPIETAPSAIEGIDVIVWGPAYKKPWVAGSDGEFWRVRAKENSPGKITNWRPFPSAPGAEPQAPTPDTPAPAQPFDRHALYLRDAEARQRGENLDGSPRRECVPAPAQDCNAKASELLMECVDFFAATMANADPRAWSTLMIYAPAPAQDVTVELAALVSKWRSDADALSTKPIRETPIHDLYKARELRACADELDAILARQQSTPAPVQSTPTDELAGLVESLARKFEADAPRTSGTGFSTSSEDERQEMRAAAVQAYDNAARVREHFAAILARQSAAPVAQKGDAE